MATRTEMMERIEEYLQTESLSCSPDNPTGILTSDDDDTPNLIRIYDDFADGWYDLQTVYDLIRKNKIDSEYFWEGIAFAENK